MFQSKCKFPYPTQLSIFAWSILWRRASIIVFSWRQNTVWHNFLAIFLRICNSLQYLVVNMSEEKEQEEKDTELDLIAEQELLRLTRQFRVSYICYVLCDICMQYASAAQHWSKCSIFYLKGSGRRQRGLSRRSVQSPQTSTKSDLRFGKLETAVCPLPHSISVQRQHQERQW